MIRSLIGKLGIDQAIFYGILGKVIQASSGLITIVFIAVFFTKSEQGYYFTFGSIIAINVFFELGLGTIITQYVAHETTNLNWKNNYLAGPIENLSRLSSLLRLAVKWFSSVSILLFIVLLFAGFYFFSSFENKNQVNWEIPWIILAFSTSVYMVISPLLAYVEGLGKIKEIAKIRFFQQLSYTVVLLGSFVSGFKLYSGGIAMMFSLILIFVLFFKLFKETLFSIWEKKNRWGVNYMSEIFPFQWKIAVSWISGYFIFQLFNPVIFANEGAISAGKMGMTLAVINGITSVAMTWINTKIPLFSKFISAKDYSSLDMLFYKTLKQMILISFSALSFTFICIALMRENDINIANRFVDNFSLFLLLLATGIFIIINALAVYLRCHKKEPFLGLSLMMGILSTISTFTLGKFYGVFGISLGYFFITGVLSFSISIYIFLKKKREWHF